MALDYRTGEVKWQHKYPLNGWGSSQQPGVLSTGGGLVFTGDPSGNLDRVRRGHRQDPVARAAWDRS